MTTLSIEVKSSLSKELDRLADTTGHSKSFHVEEAINDYLKNEAWQVGEIKEALEEVERGEVATQEEVDAVFNKWLTK